MQLDLTTDLFLIITACVSFFYLHRIIYKEHNNYKTIKIMYVVVLVMLVLDALVHVAEGHSLRALEEVYLIIVTSLIPFVGLLWLMFIINITKAKLNRKIVFWIALGLLITNTVLSILTFVSSTSIYYVFVNNKPHIGPFYFIFAIIILLPYIIGTILLLIKWQSMRRKRRPSIFIFVSTFPLIGLFAQLIEVDYTVTLSSLVVTFIIICMDIQHQFGVTDYMTGLYNRRHLAKKLKERIKWKRGDELFAGYMIDINNFKHINDAYGHAFGDEVLQDFANILLNNIGPFDLVSRFGGDEFVIICEIKDAQDVARFSDKLDIAIQTHNASPTSRHIIDISIGSAVYPKNSSMTVDNFLELLDERMYADKHHYKSKY